MTRTVRTALAALAALALAAGAGTADSALSLTHVTPPVITPDAPRPGDVVDVSFRIGFDTDWPCRVAERPVPACAFLVTWRVSLDGEWLSPGSTPLAAGHTLLEPHPVPGHRREVPVTEPVVLVAQPGEHAVHVMAIAVATLPPGDAGALAAAREHEEAGWTPAPVVTLVVDQGPLPVPSAREQKA